MPAEHARQDAVMAMQQNVCADAVDKSRASSSRIEAPFMADRALVLKAAAQDTVRYCIYRSDTGILEKIPVVR